MNDMNESLEPGAMGRLAIIIAELRTLRAGVAQLSTGADRLAAEIVEIHRMQIQTLGFMQELLTLFAAAPAPVDEAPSAYKPAAAAAGESVDAIPDEGWSNEPEPAESAPAPAQKAEKKRRSS